MPDIDSGRNVLIKGRLLNYSEEQAKIGRYSLYKARVRDIRLEQIIIVRTRLEVTILA